MRNGDWMGGGEGRSQGRSKMEERMKGINGLGGGGLIRHVTLSFNSFLLDAVTTSPHSLTLSSVCGEIGLILTLTTFSSFFFNKNGNIMENQSKTSMKLYFYYKIKNSNNSNQNYKIIIIINKKFFYLNTSDKCSVKLK